ncbi:hypothetical protein OHB00_49860 [Streptomyces sp. NBC_00631]|uniref:hypothetical protein n=1 Tax=Streptomyces sp. NBC_00631 TaxID=2975793 RepID=UPI0030DEF877
MNGQTDVRAVVLIIVGVVAGCLAYRAPELGVALMAGVGGRRRSPRPAGQLTTDAVLSPRCPPKGRAGVLAD